MRAPNEGEAFNESSGDLPAELIETPTGWRITRTVGAVGFAHLARMLRSLGAFWKSDFMRKG